MDTQNTLMHIRLWNRHFWRLALSNFFLAISAYMLIPSLARYFSSKGYNNSSIGWVMLCFALGVFVLGGFSGYLIQRFRRNVVCIVSILLMTVCTGALYYFEILKKDAISYNTLLLLRLVQGAFYGLAQMVLLGTLVIDTVEASHRTEANYSVTWFGRLALSVGPLVALMLYRQLDSGSAFLGSCISGLIAMLLVLSVKFPFRAPEETIHIFSLDRFLLIQGGWLSVTLVCSAMLVGMVLSISLTPSFFILLMIGFLLAVLAERFAFANADLRSEGVTGLLLIGIAMLLMLTRTQHVVDLIAPAFIGLGIGLIGSRFLLFFIKLSKHCQRGTSQTTYLLSWELGLGLGLFFGYNLLDMQKEMILEIGIGITIIILLLYRFYVHSWYVHHKNR